MDSKQSAPTLQQELQRGLKHQQAGELVQAERIYRAVLSAEPNNPDALHLLGTIAGQVGKHDRAVEFIRKAVSLQPSNASFWNSAGNALKNLGRLTEAEHCYRQSLLLKPDYPHAYYNLGGALEALGRVKEAEQTYEQALRLKPDLVEAHYNLGNMLQRLERYAEAEQSYRRVLALKPDHAEAHNNLGNALKALGRLEEAERSYRQALRFKPSYAIAYYNVGATLQDLARLDEAEANYRRALNLKADLPEAHYNLGNLLHALGKMKEAEESYRQAVRLKPEHAQAHYNLGMALQGQGRLPEAEQCYRQALSLNAEYAEAHCMWVYQRQHLCMWAALDLEVNALRRRVVDRKPGKIFPFTFLALPQGHADDQLKCAEQFAEAACASSLSRPEMWRSKKRAESDNLRIGYLSSDYYQHATSFLLAEVIEHHDKTRHDIFGYSYSRDDDSAIGRRIRSAFPVFREIRHLSDEDAARRIVDDGIDILVDLKGYTANARVQIPALRPAPVQVNWLGYPGSLGHRRLADYLIGDPIVTPLRHTGRYAETLALMPHCYQPNDRRRQIGPRPTRTEVGLPEDGLVFCCFNQSYKITPAMLDVWCRLLLAVPRSVLWLLQTTRAARDNLWLEARGRGVPPERIVFAPSMAPDNHLGRLQLADVALDTFPVTSHTTASDALWSGVPLVTLIGDTFISRVAASVVTAAAVPELIAADTGSYYELAYALAMHPKRLAALKHRLIANRMTCPLFDSERFTRDLERLYRAIWGQRGGEKREPIVLQPQSDRKRDRSSSSRVKAIRRSPTPRRRA